MIEENKKLVSVIIPVYNTDKKFIQECLDSVANQTLDNEDYEIVIVDDYSIKQETTVLINKLALKKDYKGISLKVIKHKENKWVAEARNTGAKNSVGKYLVFLDSDDMIKEDYLKKATLLLETSPRAGIVYPNIRRFGYINSLTEVGDFNALKIFYENYMTNASLIRKSAWTQTMQRKKFITNKVHFYEDWDNFTRIIGKGWYGLPLNDSEHLYRQHIASGGVRNYKLLTLSKYFNWRINILSFFKAYRSQKKYKKDFSTGFGKPRNLINPITHLERLSGYMVDKLHTKSSPIDHIIKYFPFKILLNSFFNPKEFIKDFLSSKKTLTFAEYYAGFLEKPHTNLIKTLSPTNNNNKSIFFVHNWWRMGGAETVLLDWIKSIQKLDVKKINIVNSSYMDDGKLRGLFEKHVNEQYALDKIIIPPMLKLKFCWNLIQKERPSVIFITYNSFFYLLTPLIKKEFPKTKIIDIIHSEEPTVFSWFGIAADYQKYIDYRIVISKTWKEVLVKRHKEKEEKIQVLPNGVDLNKFNPKKYNKLKLKEAFKVDTKKFIIGYIGRLNLEKNPQVFLELVKLMREHTDFEFIIVGSGDIEKDIQKKAKELPNVKYLGPTNDVSKYLAMCDLIVCPSKFEGYPLIGIESAAMNVPIIATDVIGFRDQINLGKFGFIYKQIDDLTDAHKIRDLILENKKKFSKIGKNGRKFVSKYHDLKKCSNKYKKFIESLLQ